MHHIFTWGYLAATTAQTEPTIIDQAPNYGGTTTTVFYVTGGLLLVGALVLWGIFLLRNHNK